MRLRPPSTNHVNLLSGDKSQIDSGMDAAVNLPFHHQPL
jgi:hypothetical protein